MFVLWIEPGFTQRQSVNVCVSVGVCWCYMSTATAELFWNIYMDAIKTFLQFSALKQWPNHHFDSDPAHMHLHVSALCSMQVAAM